MIIFDTTATSDTILADPVEVQQILMNLGTNAVHAVGSAPGRVEFRVDVLPQGDRRIPAALTAEQRLTRKAMSPMGSLVKACAHNT